MGNQGRAFFLTAWGVFLGAFAWALLGADPSFYLDDSPETVTACVTWGIPHPPGYPLHTLFGHLFSMLPLGAWGFRVNLSSAFLAASVCLFLFCFFEKKACLSRPVSVLLALFWIVGRAAYPASLSAKTGVYELTALLLLGILWCLREGRLFPVAFLFGLGFANHWMTMLALLPGVVLLAWPHWKSSSPDEGTEPHPAAKPIVLFSVFLLGASLYTILPIRALADPSLDWGNPSTWHNFLFDLFRTQYHGVEAGGGVATWVRQFGVILQRSFLEFTGLLLAAFWGLWELWRVEKGWAQGMALMWLGMAGALAVYLDLPADRLYLIAEYMLPAHLFILIACGWGWKIRFSAGRVFWRRTAYLLLCVLGLWMGSARWTQARQTDYTYAYDFVLNSFKPLPRDAFYYCKGDTLVFPAWYFQWVEGKRRDLVVVGMDGLPMDWVRKGLFESHPGLRVPRSTQPMGLEAVPALSQWMLQKNPGRDLYVSFNKLEDNSLPGLKILPYGVVGRGLLFGSSESLDEGKADFVWAGLRLRHLGEAGFPLDERTHDLTYRDYAVFRNTLGLYYEDKGDNAKAALTAHSKVGDVEAMQAAYAKSGEQYQWAQTWVPEDPQFNFNLGNACYHKGKLNDALRYYDQAIQADPSYASAYGNGAITALQLSQFHKAADYFQKVLELKPGDAQAQKGLDYLKQIHQLPG